MKQKLISLLLAVSALSLAGCGGGNLANDIATLPEVVGDTLNAPDRDTEEPGRDEDRNGELPPDEDEDPGGEPVFSGEDDGIAAPDDDTVPEDEGTANGSDDTQWDDKTGTLDEEGTYNSVEDVSLYLHLYDHLPSNYLTKSEARDLGWTGGSVERYVPGCAIGGDRFGNREGLLPTASGRSYYECDIDTIGESARGAKRIIFSNDGLIYYTEDHYESFTLLYGEE